MAATVSQEELMRHFTNLREDASSIRVPTQAQLRSLAHALDTSNLMDFEFISEESESLSPAEILSKLQNATGEMRDLIWAFAMQFETNIDDDYQDENGDDDFISSASPKETVIVTFTLFNELPYELRDKIWKHASESNRLVEIFWQIEHHRWWASKSSRFPAPGVFAACRESRDSTRALRERRFMKVFGTWTNLYSDLLWINTFHAILSRRFMNFCMDLYEVWDNPNGDEDRDDLDGQALTKLPRLAVSWEMWEGMLERVIMGDDLSVGGEGGLLRKNFKGLKELVLVQIEEVMDQGGKLYRDERVLVEDELLDATPSESLPNPGSALERTCENLKFAPGECEVRLKRLQRGNDGVGGVRSEYIFTDPGFFRHPHFTSTQSGR
ncbi:hypothetical protein EG329_002658 [Mollisiaceae sp. DMI_Dod_QoI]|nr:hypothetical protein EG329_002658 [Helotiales sp. DMI_Dod_QoI]